MAFLPTISGSTKYPRLFVNAISFFGALCLGATEVVAGEMWSPEQINAKIKSCMLSSPRIGKPQNINAASLGLKIKVPRRYIVAPFTAGDGGITIISEERYIEGKCSRDVYAFSGVPPRGTTYGALSVYKGTLREGGKPVPCGEVISLGRKYSVFCGLGTRWVTIIHPVTKQMMTLEGWAIPREVVIETAHHLKTI